MTKAKRADLCLTIAGCINVASAENGSDTPDFIIAEYLVDCLEALDAAVRKREKWYGRAPQKVPNELKPTSKGPRT